MPTTPTDNSGEGASRGSNWMRALPFVILSLAAIVLLLKWESIPDHWPIHWGGNREPNGWATKTIMAWFVFAVVGAAIVYGTMRLWNGVRELKRAGQKGLEGYNGIIYNNPNDPRLWVPKISGLGYTLNFAHPWARPIMIAILVLVVLIVVLGILPGIRQSVAR